MKKINIDVSGMHCNSCEIILEKSIKKVQNVTKVNANQRKWTLEIFFDEKAPNIDEVEKIIKENWYSVWIQKKLPWINTNINDYIDILGILMVLFIIFIIFKNLWVSFWNIGSGNPTLWVAFIVWLTAWISSCMALVWWLILWISAKWSKDMQNASRWTRFEPHLYFNLWRVLGFGIFWWILWLFGSFISLSNVFLWIMTFIVGWTMILLWINLTKISPKLANFSVTLPKFLSKNVWDDNSWKTWAAITWALSFFLPCWFTLAMQMYAISTWNFVSWFLIMALFALGTAPWLMWIWALTSVLKWDWAKKFFKFTWVIVLVLGIYNISNWYTLISLWAPSNLQNQNIDSSNLETQEIRMTQNDNWYSPNVIKIKPNTKIKLIVTSTSPYNCASQLVIPSVWISTSLKQWENIVEFISPSSWEVKFSCSMWMYSWKFIVEWTSGNTINENTAQINQDDSSSQSAVKCWLSNTNQTWKSEWCNAGSIKTPTETINSNSTDSEVETINLSYSSQWLSWNISASAWKKYKIIIDVKDTISWCMSTILIPWLDENIQMLKAWNKVVFNIDPKESWQYPITCAMWVPHWFINVN
ncbi:MAG: heavy metal-binding protein [uncultured bacterium (gcode 4)]|uniref:Heavy metal-binding protein n=1 Tax=uncultured bacterium (gcode 4) TaxID=1234023 RepID=K2G8B0_9BACT|nr:MAG: heavy metal-binding protein [uncultured bacterium (gcode 4)]